MKQKTLVYSLLVTMLVAVIVALSLSNRALAQVDANASPSSAEEGAALVAPENPPESGAPEGLTSWRVAGSALKPRENDVNYAVGGEGGCVYATAGDPFTVWNIPVQLPQGALVDSLRMYYDDTSGSSSDGFFTVYDLYGNIVQEWYVGSLGNYGPGYNDTLEINHTIDYNLYSYVLNWRPVATGSTMQLCGFRVFYTAPLFGAGFVPVVHNDNP